MSTSLVLSQPAFVQQYPELRDTGVPDWLPFAMEQTVKWLTLSYEGHNGGSENTTKSYAIDLGVPRAMQTWRAPITSQRGRRSPGPRPQAFLRWCAAFDVNPFTDIDVDVAHTWLKYALLRRREHNAAPPRRHDQRLVLGHAPPRAHHDRVLRPG